jgi:truncated hemoglobin YjbI
MFEFLFNFFNGFKKIKNVKHLKEIATRKDVRIDAQMEGVWLKDMPEAIKETMLETEEEKLEQILQLCPHRYKKN